MFGTSSGHGGEGDRDDTFGYDEEKLDWFERFDLSPVPPEPARQRVDNGRVLRTLDLPEYLGRQLVVDCETGLAYYRLTQLFGTPNVPTLSAGTPEMPPRDVTTWQYLFDVTYDGGDDDEDREFLLSVYDHKTDVSAGLSVWDDPDHDSELSRPIRPPTDDPPAALTVYDDEFTEGIVQLVLNAVEEPVPATFKELWL